MGVVVFYCSYFKLNAVHLSPVKTVPTTFKSYLLFFEWEDKGGYKHLDTA